MSHITAALAVLLGFAAQGDLVTDLVGYTLTLERDVPLLAAIDDEEPAFVAHAGDELTVIGPASFHAFEVQTAKGRGFATIEAIFGPEMEWRRSRYNMGISELKGKGRLLDNERKEAAAAREQEELEAQWRREDEEAIRDEESRRRGLISAYGEEVGLRLINRQVWIGMTARQARESWGLPNKVNRTITAGVTHEQWVYDNENYLYFVDGRLDAIQN